MNELASWNIRCGSVQMGVVCMTASCTFLMHFVALYFGFLTACHLLFQYIFFFVIFTSEACA